MRSDGTLRSRIPDLLLVTATLAALAWGWVEATVCHDARDTSAEAANVASLLASHVGPGDLVVVSPPTSLVLSEPLRALAAAPAPPTERLLAERYSRVWTVDLTEDSDLADEPPSGFVARDDTPDGLPSSVGLLEGTKGEPRGVRLVDILDTARVELVPDDGSAPKPCGPFTGSRWVCGKGGWAMVGRVVARVDGKPALCMWAHPHDGSTLRISFPGVTLGNALGGSAAFVDGTGAGADVDIAFLAGEEPLGRLTVPGKPSGVTQIGLLTLDRAGQTVELRVQVTARKARWRKLCIDPVVLTDGAQGGR